MTLKSASLAYLRKLFYFLIGIACLDVTDVLVAAAGTMKAATASSLSAVTLTAADLLTAGKAALLLCPRQLRFTTAGVTPADAPATATIVGMTLAGPITEVVNIAQTATFVDTVYFYTRIDSITYSVGQGVAATVAIGITTALGLPVKAKGRGAASAVFVALREFIDGVTAGPASQSGTATLITGTVTVSGVTLTASSRILLTMKDPGAGALSDFAGLDAPVGTRDASAGTFVVNAIQGADKAVLATAACTFDWEIVEGAGTGRSGTITSPTTHKPNGSYTPGANVIPNTARDYLVVYESDPDGG